jgi:DNA primase
MTKSQEFALSYLGSIDDYSESGSEIATRCPFCGEHRHKLYISADGKYICFKCGIHGGSLISLIMHAEHTTRKNAYRILKEHGVSSGSPRIISQADDFNLFTELSTLMYKKPETKSLSVPRFPEGLKMLEDNLSNPESYPYLWYLKHRGLSLEDIIDNHIGYIVKGSVERDNKPPLEINNSIVFITYNMDNQPIYWSTRSIEMHPYVKSLNGMSRANEYSKKNVIWNMNHITNDCDMVICEGVFNAISCTQGNYVGVATFGKNITNDQIRLMRDLNPRNYLLFLDNDASQQQLELYQRLVNMGVANDKIRLVENPYGNKDANELGRTITKELLDNSQPITLYNLIEMRLK